MDILRKETISNYSITSLFIFFLFFINEGLFKDWFALDSNPKYYLLLPPLVFLFSLFIDMLLQVVGIFLLTPAINILIWWKDKPSRSMNSPLFTSSVTETHFFMTQHDLLKEISSPFPRGDDFYYTQILQLRISITPYLREKQPDLNDAFLKMKTFSTLTLFFLLLGLNLAFLMNPLSPFAFLFVLLSFVGTSYYLADFAKRFELLVQHFIRDKYKEFCDNHPKMLGRTLPNKYEWMHQILSQELPRTYPPSKYAFTQKK